MSALEKISEAARRYAKALYSIAKDEGQPARVFAELRVLAEQVFHDELVHEYFASPLISPEQKKTVLQTAIKDKGLSPDVVNFLLLLAEKNRLGLFEQISRAFQEMIDGDHGVTRGMVRSASTLKPDARKRIEDIVTKVTGKQVILQYTEDKSLIGGLIAQVGGWTFDDSLQSHLRRMNEELKRSAN
jgi:F-type H+-transporting ATPase subunit delta